MDYYDCYSIYDLDLPDNQLADFENAFRNDVEGLVDDHTYNNVFEVDDSFYQGLYDDFVEDILNHIDLPEEVRNDDELWEKIVDGTFESLLTDYMSGPIALAEDYCRDNGITINGKLSAWRQW